MTMGASHFDNTSPQKWNGVTANNCATTHTVWIEVALFDSQGGIIDSCQSGFVNNYTKCQATGSPASAYHKHQFANGSFLKTFFAWQSND